MGIKADKTFEEIVERLVMLYPQQVESPDADDLEERSSQDAPAPPLSASRTPYPRNDRDFR